jgi:hypothetical protein
MNDWAKPEAYVTSDTLFGVPVQFPRPGAGLEKETVRFLIPNTAANRRAIFGPR